MQRESFEKAIDHAIKEIDALMAENHSSDVFLKDVRNHLLHCRTNGYVASGDNKETLRLLGQAAVRNYDSFDSVPEAKTVVSLAVQISSHIKQT